MSILNVDDFEQKEAKEAKKNESNLRPEGEPPPALKTNPILQQWSWGGIGRDGQHYRRIGSFPL